MAIQHTGPLRGGGSVKSYSSQRTSHMISTVSFFHQAFDTLPKALKHSLDFGVCCKFGVFICLAYER